MRIKEMNSIDAFPNTSLGKLYGKILVLGFKGFSYIIEQSNFV